MKLNMICIKFYQKLRNTKNLNFRGFKKPKKTGFFSKPFSNPRFLVWLYAVKRIMSLLFAYEHLNQLFVIMQRLSRSE